MADYGTCKERSLRMSWATFFQVASQVVSSGAQVYSAAQTAEAAKEQQKLQEQEARRQQQIAEAEARRVARVRQAKLYAQQGQSGAITSGTSAGVVGISTTLEAGLDELSERTEFNINSSELQMDATLTKAYTQGVVGAASLAAGTIKLTDSIPSTQPELSNYGPYRDGYRTGGTQ